MNGRIIQSHFDTLVVVRSNDDKEFSSTHRHWNSHRICFHDGDLQSIGQPTSSMEFLVPSSGCTTA